MEPTKPRVRNTSKQNGHCVTSSGKLMYQNKLLFLLFLVASMSSGVTLAIWYLVKVLFFLDQKMSVSYFLPEETISFSMGSPLTKFD